MYWIQLTMSSQDPIENRLEVARRRFEELKKKKSLAQKRPGDSPRESETATPQPDQTADQSELVAELRATVEQQKETIKKLRHENTDLKLEKMDLSDKIADLEDELKKVQKREPATVHNSYSQQEIVQESSNFREKLMAWKGWQVDMTQWSGSQSTKVAL